MSHHVGARRRGQILRELLNVGTWSGIVDGRRVSLELSTQPDLNGHSIKATVTHRMRIARFTAGTVIEALETADGVFGGTEQC